MIVDDLVQSGGTLIECAKVNNHNNNDDDGKADDDNRGGGSVDKDEADNRDDDVLQSIRLRILWRMMLLCIKAQSLL